jgi:hypothetical protein
MIPDKLHFNFLDPDSDGADVSCSTAACTSIDGVIEKAHKLVERGLKAYAKKTRLKLKRKAEIDRDQTRLFAGDANG